MDIGNFLDENHIKEEIPVDNMYQPEMSDLNLDEENTAKEEKSYTFDGWKKAFAQALMMGYHKKDIMAKYKVNMKVAGNMQEAEKYLDQKDGLIGSIFVDCSCFDKEFDYSKCASKMKKYHRFAINCHCKKVVSKTMRKNASDGTMDGILNEEPVKVVYQKEVCDKCGLPVIYSLKEIPQDVLVGVVDELVASKEIGFNEGEKIKASSNILSELRVVFAKKVGRYKVTKANTKVDKTANEFALVDESLEVEPIQPGKVEGVVMDVYVPEVEVDNKQEEITFDNQEYVDDEWFEKEDIKLEDSDFVSQKEEVKIKNDFSFDF